MGYRITLDKFKNGFKQFEILDDDSKELIGKIMFSESAEKLNLLDTFMENIANIIIDYCGYATNLAILTKVPNCDNDDIVKAFKAVNTLQELITVCTKTNYTGTLRGVMIHNIIGIASVDSGNEVVFLNEKFNKAGEFYYNKDLVGVYVREVE